jgi:hypothetical protein
VQCQRMRWDLGRSAAVAANNASTTWLGEFNDADVLKGLKIRWRSSEFYAYRRSELESMWLKGLQHLILALWNNVIV